MRSPLSRPRTRSDRRPPPFNTDGCVVRSWSEDLMTTKNRKPKFIFLTSLMILGSASLHAQTAALPEATFSEFQYYPQSKRLDGPMPNPRGERNSAPSVTDEPFESIFKRLSAEKQI